MKTIWVLANQGSPLKWEHFYWLVGEWEVGVTQESWRSQSIRTILCRRWRGRVQGPESTTWMRRVASSNSQQGAGTSVLKWQGTSWAPIQPTSWVSLEAASPHERATHQHLGDLSREPSQACSDFWPPDLQNGDQSGCHLKQLSLWQFVTQDRKLIPV